MQERLHKFIASTGIVSRRKAEELIVAGLVLINNKRVTKLGMTIDPKKDSVTVNGEVLKPVTAFRYIALNKPIGVTCTRAQFPSERTIYDLVPNSRDLVIAGRLDKDSEGLVLLTNDGELTNKLTHPRYEHEKEYEVTTIKPLNEAVLKALREGVKLEEGKAVVDMITTVAPKLYRIVIHQGWKRQIRRMIGSVHHDIERLVRIRINKLELKGLNTSAWRVVTKSDIV